MNIYSLYLLFADEPETKPGWLHAGVFSTAELAKEQYIKAWAGSKNVFFAVYEEQLDQPDKEPVFIFGNGDYQSLTLFYYPAG